MKINKIADVFRTTGQPTVTYVERKSGDYEKKLSGYLDECGQICLVTGPSKTGKTTLYKRVLGNRGEIPLVVQCTVDRKCEEIWRVALEQVNFERISRRSNSEAVGTAMEAGADVEFGWHWLAKITGKLSASASESEAEDVVKERILSRPSPDLLIPILRDTNYVLVIEDFHYLDDKEKRVLFQQWKRFVDSEISIIILGTSHRAVDIANSNKDLIGRVSQIDIGRWSNEDLSKICRQGFEYLGYKAYSNIINTICTESVGLPIIVQQVCLQLFNNENIFLVNIAKKKEKKFDNRNCEDAFYEVASEKYSQLETYYQTLIRGPREKNRKYKTYELVIGCFSVDPISFSLTRKEIDERLDKVCVNSKSRPPAASINSTLGALKKFQDKRDFNLLEWRPSEDTLYIVEPTFLFYVRWRRKAEKGVGVQLDFLSELLLMIRDDNDKSKDPAIKGDGD
ncbi:AAA family ATPase [Breoghania sp.]|uniref:AAA family ATPase n=1 Tax=Breoghania sp. TaxID=2065378 RepID=UPI002AA743B9|nr:AAA family ATPase [Breoghania sp.]